MKKDWGFIRTKILKLENYVILDEDVYTIDYGVYYNV